jgi:ribosome recycling factor
MFEGLKNSLQQVLDIVSDDLKQIKAGRAKPSLIEHLKVEAYEGQIMPLIELASITAPDPHLLVITPWDKSILESIEKSLSKSDLSLNPVVDGDLIRIAVPPLTQERREELVKLVKQRIESGRQMIRSTRNDQKKEIDDMKGKPDVSEDDIERHLEEMQTIVDQFNEKLEEIGNQKEAELMEI